MQFVREVNTIVCYGIETKAKAVKRQINKTKDPKF